MNINDVVVIRTNEGDDIIGTLLSSSMDGYHIHNPYFVRYSATTGVSLVPYCFLTDEKDFFFHSRRIEFVALASKMIADRFASFCESNDESTFTNLVEGNDTKH